MHIRSTELTSGNISGVRRIAGFHILSHRHESNRDVSRYEGTSGSAGAGPAASGFDGRAGDRAHSVLLSLPIQHHRKAVAVDRSPHGLSDEQLAAIIQDAAVEVYVLYVSGVPAGYAELDRRQFPDIELAYFGIIPEFIGQKLGPYLLRWSIDKAFSYSPRRLWLHTCTLDHPIALATYQRAGFRIYRTEAKDVDDS